MERVNMAIQRKTVRYEIDGKAFESLAVWDDANPGARPGVLIAPTFMGRTAFEDDKAETLAEKGYVGFSIDIFGIDVRPANFDEAGAAMKLLNDNRAIVAQRMTAALEQIRTLDIVYDSQIATIGFCFGGKCALDLARTGADVKGVVTFHGIFDKPDFEVADRYPAKILALHGWDDPLAKPEDVIGFAAEMTEKAADWQLQAYGHTEHGFTNYNREDMYREAADRRSWQALQNFLGELFG
jgi:dienelactone hydrolase